MQLVGPASALADGPMEAAAYPSIWTNHNDMINATSASGVYICSVYAAATTTVYS